MSGRLAVTGVVTTDAALRESAAVSVAADVPDAVVVRHDLRGFGRGTLRRVVSDATGVLEDVTLALEHSCLSCALREDLLPTLVRLAGTGRWSRALALLPVAAEPVPFVRGVLDGAHEGRDAAEDLDLHGVVAVVAGHDLVEGLMGCDSLAERDLALGEDDERSHGEVLARQLRGADLVLVDGAADATALALLAHLTTGEVRLAGAHQVSGQDVLRRRHDPSLSRGWEDPLAVAPTGAPGRDGVWTLDLSDWRPLHPRRLREHLEPLAAGSLVSRGRFWLPTRPATVGVWEGAGGQLSIGEAGPWWGAAPSTRLVVTGVDEDPARVRSAFEACLLTDAELAAGLHRWTGRPDGFDRWLGRVGEEAA